MQSSLSPAAALKIEYRPIAELTPYKGNARKHPQGQIRKLAKSLRNFGWTNPLLIDRENMVLCGHGRLEAAKLLGEKSVPVIVLEHLSEADRRAYINRHLQPAVSCPRSRAAAAAGASGIAPIVSDQSYLPLPGPSAPKLAGSRHRCRRGPPWRREPVQPARARLATGARALRSCVGRRSAAG